MELCPRISIVVVVTVAVSVVRSERVAPGVVTPMPTFPVVVTLIRMAFDVRTESPCASVVPRKFVPGVVPLLPVNVHTVASPGCFQLRVPVPSFVSTVPLAPCAMGSTYEMSPTCDPAVNCGTPPPADSSSAVGSDVFGGGGALSAAAAESAAAAVSAGSIPRRSISGRQASAPARIVRRMPGRAAPVRAG